MSQINAKRKKNEYTLQSLFLIIRWARRPLPAPQRIERERERGREEFRTRATVEESNDSIFGRRRSCFCSKCYSFPIEREAAVLKRRATTFPFR